jgi:hypothetical protein
MASWTALSCDAQPVKGKKKKAFKVSEMQLHFTP